MNAYEKVCEYYNNYQNLCQTYGIKDADEIQGFIQGLAQHIGCNDDTAMDIWYARQRSWFCKEMVQALIDLEKAPKGTFRPILTTGEFEWDETNRCFIPESSGII